MLGPPASREDFEESALESLNNNEATVKDDIPTEILNNYENITKEQLFKFIKKCYEEGFRHIL